ncbi:hypothetical protein LZ575_20620 [Antarcticibacterium sp. 1MA-6-2]|uniref:hypothetical protein n=1 Tax=Antarcticibacterium sp. 1MA-6-2 TaxID=2908210 RepID=UPI001F44534B|nr:hypothetical protein [Antarcticibacterium sp. 1MA-6-2]UJH91039.1 hypothetical protein LZ575_20620 [Antarcticibacterium sp. 1MA-6-2]
MIIIEKPHLQLLQNDLAELSVKFTLENKEQKLWYTVPGKYEKYLVTENLDAFLVGLLFLALKKGEDITLKGPVSSKLLYSINHYLIPALCLANPDLKEIKVNALELNENNLNVGNVAATGLSCGVDSFSAYYDHRNETGSYKIKYFTFFNAGSHGSGGNFTQKVFKQRLKKSEKFAAREGKEIIPIDSNLSEILMMKFQKTNTLRNASCALLLQKLFRNYYSASKNRFDFFKLHDYDTQDYDSLILNMLSTESTTFFSAVANLTRLERTSFIADFEGTYDHLDICTSPRRKQEEGINCSKCKKCLRTALTLDLLGKLERYENVFHLDVYRKNKDNFIWYIISTRNDNQISSDLYKLLKEKNEINYYKIALSKLKNQKKKIYRLVDGNKNPDHSTTKSK